MNVNEEGNTLGNLGSDNIEKVGGDSIKAKSIPSQNVASSSKLKAPQVKVDPLFPQRLKKKDENTKF